MYNSNTDSLGLILDVEVFFSLGHCSGALCITLNFFLDLKKSLFSKSFVIFSENTITKTFTSNSELNLMVYKAVDCHNMMGGRGFRVEQLKNSDFCFPIPSPANRILMQQD